MKSKNSLPLLMLILALSWILLLFLLNYLNASIPVLAAILTLYSIINLIINTGILSNILNKNKSWLGLTIINICLNILSILYVFLWILFEIF
jgi:hypothetical protein